MTDWDLIQLYAQKRPETAFSELARRHLAWVHSVAVRRVRHPQLAEEVSQSVFILLARKAGSLRSGTILSGWLFRTTCFVANHALRAEFRQKNREQTASSMILDQTSADDQEAIWERVQPCLDQAVAGLSEPDRLAILMRFYEKKPLSEVGRQLGISEDAAKKRVSRAVDKLRRFLVQRGVTVAATALAAILGQKIVQAVPAGLGTNITSAACASLTASALLPELARETLSAWRVARIKLVAVASIASLATILIFLAGTRLHQSVSSATGDEDPPSTKAIQSQQRLRPAGPQLAQRVNAPALLAAKTGVLTGLVVDEEGRPIQGATVWGGFNFRPYAQDTTDAAGQFALDKIASPNLI